MADTLGIVIISVVYRHTPDWPHPAQNQDAEDAMAYIENNASNLGIDVSSGLGVLGISAGAGLAAAMAIRDCSHFRLITSVTLSIPWLIHVENYPFEMFSSADTSSKTQCRDAPVIPWPRLKMFSDLVDGGHDGSASKDPLLNAALRPDKELRGWPKTAILVAGMDPLRDDGLLLATRLKALK
jgi:acetyl esterase/lipase